MVPVIVVLAMLLGLPGHSDAAFCVCNGGLSDSVLQKNIDYACGSGADCTAIQQNGACFNPNTVKDHCNYAVNSYYQRKGQGQGSCDFTGTAAISQNPPSAGSGCVYQSNPSTGGGTNTPPTTPTVGGTPTSPTMGGTPASPNIGGTPTTPNTGGISTPPGTIAPPGTMPGTTNPIGLAPSGSGSGFGSTTDGSGAGMKLPPMSGVFTLLAICTALLSSSFFCQRA